MRKPVFSTSFFSFIGLLLLAALGQLLLIQKDIPWTLPVGLFCYILAGTLLLALPQKNPSTPSSRSTYLEWSFLFFIIVLAFSLRVYRLDRFPAGIFPDEGHLALIAEKMAAEHWHPFKEIFQWPVCVPSTYYTLDAWFHFLPPSQISFFLYSVFLSLLALPFFYFFYRSLFDRSAALTALYFFAVSRWFLTYSRDGHPAIEVLFYMALTLALWTSAVSSAKSWLFALCGFALALGLYSYQDLKFLPFLILGYAIYEWRWSNDKSKFLKNTLLLFTFTVIFSLPMLWHILLDHGLSFREKQLLVFPNLYLEKGIKGVWDHLWETLLVYNRQGDFWPYHNIPNHRQLDDVTGVLWVLGALYGLFHIKERRYFYPLLGFSLFILPAFLSIDSRHASRLIGTLPFVFFLAGQTGSDIYQKAKTFWPKTLILVLSSVLLLLSASQNTRDYFEVQANNIDCWRVLGGAEDTWVADSIRRYSPNYNCLLCQKFYGNFQISFLDYGLFSQIDDWKLPHSLYLQGKDPRKGICLFFEEGHWGALKLFQDLYPGGTTEFFRDLNGNPIAALYSIPAPALAAGLKKLSRHPFVYGLKGTYYQAAEEKGTPVITQIDPVLNFTFRNDFPFTDFPPLAVHWSGTVNVPKDGTYEWLALTTDGLQMDLDKKTVLTNQQKDNHLFLRKGKHSLHIHFQKTHGVDTAFSLFWKTPGSSTFTSIPPEVLKPGR